DPIRSVAHTLLRRQWHWPGSFIAGNATFQFGAEMPDQSLNRPRGRVTQGADGVPFDFLADLLQEIDFGAYRVANHQPVHDAPHPAAAFPAGRTLAAGFVLIDGGKSVDRLQDCGDLYQHIYNR